MQEVRTDNDFMLPQIFHLNSISCIEVISLKPITMEPNTMKRKIKWNQTYL